MADINKLISKAYIEYTDTLAYARIYVNENLEELKGKYKSKYLAIANKIGIIDSDENKNSLIQRLKSCEEQRGVVIYTIDNLTKQKISNN